MEFFEEPRDDEGVTEVQKEAAEHQALVFQVGGVWSRVDVAHRNLWQQEAAVGQLYSSRGSEEDKYTFM